MEQSIQLEETGSDVADFGARVVAFSADLALAAGGYFLTLKLASLSDAFDFDSRAWVALWLVLFIVYEAYASSGGRRSLGKALVGLRVVDLEGEPLTSRKAALRSVFYIVSSVLNLGFLWSLFDPMHQCWHDKVAGSLVIEDRPQTPARRAVLMALACACMVLLGGLWVWNNLVAARYHAIMKVADAEMGLDELKRLEQLHFYAYGNFADNLPALARQSGAPAAFLRDMRVLFDPDSGVQITATKTSYRIVAHAHDANKTLIAFNGP